MGPVSVSGGRCRGRREPALRRGSSGRAGGGVRPHTAARPSKAAASSRRQLAVPVLQFARPGQLLAHPQRRVSALHCCLEASRSEAVVAGGAGAPGRGAANSRAHRGCRCGVQHR